MKYILPIFRHSLSIPPPPIINLTSPKNLIYIENKSKGPIYENQRQKVQTLTKYLETFPGFSEVYLHYK